MPKPYDSAKILHVNQNTKPPIISIVGRSGVGKTTFLTKLVTELKRRGYRVAVLKHHGPKTLPAGSEAVSHQAVSTPEPFTGSSSASREVEFDIPGKDTWRHFQAGADTVVISGQDRMAIYQRLTHEPTPDELAQFLPQAVDIVLTEGYTSAGKPAVEIMRRARGTESIATGAQLLAIVSDVRHNSRVPQFGLDDAQGVATLLERRFNLAPTDLETQRPTER